MNKYKAVKIDGIKHDEHRVIANVIEAGPDIVVHHIDGDKSNNLPSNLEVMSRSDHCKLHDFGRSIRPDSMLLFFPDSDGKATCRKCGAYLEFTDFPKGSRMLFGRRSSCKTCTARMKREWRRAKSKGLITSLPYVESKEEGSNA